MKEQELSIETDIIFDHLGLINIGFASIDHEIFREASERVLAAIRDGKTIYTAGNGASASIAQHWACDYTKGCSDLLYEAFEFKPRVISLSANIPLMTAISNDISYDQVYAYQLERLGTPGDVFISISSSGNSPSVVKACEMAIEMEMSVIALTGFDGGKTKKLAHYPLHVDINEYEATEDVHQAIMHMMAKYIRAKKFI
jgi:D-sedoheptulose 7-phosphate isomerase/D-glycero-D-manno-heptose 1,7-bisphosphate phosphatase